jgi:3-deoxy-D-manno-octulosonic-acid transferase
MSGPNRPTPGPADVLLLDSLGELAGLYAVARGAFVGGTLVPTGGHNPLEPAAAGVPVACGPSMENFREIAAAFDTEGAWRRVSDASELATVFRDWIGRPDGAGREGDQARAVLEARRGALPKTLDLLAPLLGDEVAAQ